MSYENDWTNESFFEEVSKPNDWQKEPIRIKNLDTGEIYPSLNVAGRKLGFLSNLKIPKNIGRGDHFKKGGVRLQRIT